MTPSIPGNDPFHAQRRTLMMEELGRAAGKADYEGRRGHADCIRAEGHTRGGSTLEPLS